MTTRCPFCDDVWKAEERIVSRNELAWAFLTNIPITPGHVLIAPVRHAASIEELTDAERAALHSLRARVAIALRAAFAAEGFNYAWNEGAVAGQSVPHFHLHVVPRVTGDAGVHGFEPRQFLYRPGSRAVSPSEELRQTAALVRAALAP